MIWLVLSKMEGFPGRDRVKAESEAFQILFLNLYLFSAVFLHQFKLIFTVFILNFPRQDFGSMIVWMATMTTEMAKVDPCACLLMMEMIEMAMVDIRSQLHARPSLVNCQKSHTTATLPSPYHNSARRRWLRDDFTISQKWSSLHRWTWIVWSDIQVIIALIEVIMAEHAPICSALVSCIESNQATALFCMFLFLLPSSQLCGSC